MSANGKQDQFRLGFLTALEVPEQGHVGGLLITNRHGRPLEFQCTAPVKPNRTQQILYGPTLEAFLLGELIGKALVEKSGVKPHLILTERAEILELRNHIPVPVACLEPHAPPPVPAPSEAQSDTPVAVEEIPLTLRIGRQWVRFHASHAEDRPAVEKESAQVSRDSDLREPFERVREALLETVRSGAVK
jgi:hypothetical protein